MTKRELFLAVLYSFHGTPYVWAGDDPNGFDCSGLINEGAESVGLLKLGDDWTADAWSTKGTPVLVEKDLLPGDLLFWFTGPRAHHVEAVYTMIDGRPYTIGASGGGSKTLTAADAAKQNAYVKIRPAKSGYLARRIF